MPNELDDLIYAAAAAMQSIAATLTVEARRELSKLKELLDRSTALPREQSASLAAGVEHVRDHLLIGPTPDPVGDGNRLWEVFSAAWQCRQLRSAAQSARLNALDSLSFIVESHSQLCHGEVKDELWRLCTQLQGNEGFQFPGWESVLAQVAEARQGYSSGSEERRRGAVHAL